MATRVEPAATQTGARPQSGPRVARRRRQSAKPLVVLGVAFILGQLLARAIDWKGHA